MGNPVLWMKLYWLMLSLKVPQSILSSFLMACLLFLHLLVILIELLKISINNHCVLWMPPSKANFCVLFSPSSSILWSAAGYWSLKRVMNFLSQYFLGMLKVLFFKFKSSYVQDTGKTKFEDGWRTGVQSEVINDLQIACPIPEVNMVGHSGTSHDQGAVLATILLRHTNF